MHSPWYQTTCNSEGSPILHLGDKSWSPLDGTVARHSSRPPAESNFELHMHALKKEMANHSSVLAWRIPGTEEPDGLPSMGSHSRTRLKRLSRSTAVSLNFSCGSLWVVHASSPAQPAPSRARTLEAGQGFGRLAQHRAASRPLAWGFLALSI